MLNCVYHPLNDMQVVDNDEKERLLATGVWFDHPTKAKEFREKMEKEVRDEPKIEPVKRKSKAKLEDKDHEKSSNV